MWRLGLHADKLVYLSSHRGIWQDEARTKVYSHLTVAQVQKMLEEGKVTEGVLSRVRKGLEAIDRGVERVNLLDGQDGARPAVGVLQCGRRWNRDDP